MNSCLLLLWVSIVMVHGAPSQVKMEIPADEQYRLSFSPYTDSFLHFTQQFGKTYTSREEREMRFKIFLDNVRQIENHNRKYHTGEVTYFLGINHFADLTFEEYQRMNRLGDFAPGLGEDSLKWCVEYKSSNSSSDYMDWHLRGAVGYVKEQGGCGGCWTFSTTGSTEGQYYLKTKKMADLSEQQILDCCTDSDCAGCDGGYMKAAYKYINQSGGLELENDYPYIATRGVCHSDKSKVKVKITGCGYIKEGDENDLKDAVGNIGPISVGVDANHLTFSTYQGGVYENENCKKTFIKMNHAMLVTGYGKTPAGVEYWIIKNSWGTTWGEEGYMRLKRNANNQCGIATLASFPRIELP